MFDDQNHFSSHDFSNMDNHTDPMFANEHHNIWYDTPINPFYKNDAQIHYGEDDFLKSKSNGLFQFSSGKRQSNVDEVIQVLSQNKWLRYALITALMLAAIFSSW